MRTLDINWFLTCEW